MQAFADEARLPVTESLVTESETADGGREGRTGFTDLSYSRPYSGASFGRFSEYDKAQSAQDQTGGLEKYLSPSWLKRSLSYRPSTSSSLMGRATYAASSILITHDDADKSTLNTHYLLAVLTSAVAQSAYRPYWRRSVSQPFSEFGSTIGNDAGINVLHEFGPGLRQLMKSHEPKFVSRIEEHVNRK